MNEIFELIRTYESWFYIITYVWTALEGETFVIFAGMAAQRELLDIRLLFLAAALGSMTGDQVVFFLGRMYGRRIVHRFPKIEPKLERVYQAIDKYSVSFILSYRFMYGLRNVSALAIGMSHLSWRRFAILNTIASFLWAAAFCGAGYLFGDIMQRMGIGDEGVINLEIRTIMLTVLGIFLLVIFVRYYRARQELAEMEIIEELPEVQDEKKLEEKKEIIQEDAKKTGTTTY